MSGTWQRLTLRGRTPRSSRDAARFGHHSVYGHARWAGRTGPAPAGSARGRALGPCRTVDRAGTIACMSDIRPPLEPESAPGTEPQPVSEEKARAGVEPLRLRPLLPRRKSPWLVVEVDGSAGCQGALLWALREAARREATVVAVSVLDPPDGDPLEGSARILVRAHLAAHDRLEA